MVPQWDRSVNGRFWTWPFLNSAQRVAPLQAVVSRKIAVGGTEFRSVLDGESSQVRVGGEISARAQRPEQLADKLQVARAGMHDGRRRLIQPGSHQVKSRIYGQRTPEQARPGGEPEERQQHVPRKSDGFLSGQRRFQPGLGLPVQWGLRVDRVDQQVRIEKYHLRNVSFRLSSSSSIASATASALSRSEEHTSELQSPCNLV